MTDTHNEHIEQEAIAWFSRRRSPLFTSKEAAEFDRWLAADAAHTAAFARVERSWDRTGAQQEALSDMLEAMEATYAPAKPRNWLRPVALAASLLLAAVLGVVLIDPGGSHDSYATAFGETRAVTLPDGSSVELFAATTLRVSTQNPRQVSLDRGSAYFDIAPDPETPFEVEALGRTVRVLGTQFAVILDQNKARLAVAEGQVSLSAEDPILLSAGEQIDYTEAGSPKPVRRVDTSSIAPWRAGRFLFDRTPLGEAVTRLNGYYGPVFKITDPALGDLSVNGVYKHSTPQETAIALEAILPITITRQDDGRLLITQPR